MQVFLFDLIPCAITGPNMHIYFLLGYYQIALPQKVVLLYTPIHHLYIIRVSIKYFIMDPRAKLFLIYNKPVLHKSAVSSGS